MKAKKHYVPVKKDLSNLKKQILWCQTHDNESKTIADNATELYNQIMTQQNICCFLSHIINSISHNYVV